MSIGIYKIENLINGNKYIGQSQNINQRWRSHRAYAETKDTPLYKAIRKYGIENFSFEILEECKIEELNDKEVYWINFYDSYRNGYNQTIGGDGNRHSVKLSEEQVFEIYKRLEGIETMEKIAKDYNVSHVTISNINTGMIWTNSNIDYPIRKKVIEQNHCIDCSKEIGKGALRCVFCANKARQMIERPNREELKNMIRIEPFTKIGEMFKVTDNAVRKWCDQYNLPRKKKDINSYSDEEWDLI